MSALNVPRVSVLMPAKDAMPHLPEAVESVLRQDFSDFELIIIDDGSTDGTWGYLSSLADPRIQLIRHESCRRVIPTLNEGLKLCRAPLIARMDADDICMPSRLRRQVAQFDADPELSLAATSARAFGAGTWLFDVPEADDRLRAFLVFGSVFPHGAVMMRREFLVRHGLEYSSNAVHAEDYDLWVRIARHGKLAGIREPLVLYRLHPGSVSHQNRGIQTEAADRCRAQATMQFLGVDSENVNIAARRSLAGVVGYRNVKTGDDLLEVARWRSRLSSAARGMPAFQAEIAWRWRLVVRRAAPMAVVSAFARSPRLTLASRGWLGISDRPAKASLALIRGWFRPA